MSILFEPVQFGEFRLRNRVVLAPLTRCRADYHRVPNALMAAYYAQRARMGLLITEATSVEPMGVGYPRTPGIWSEAQVAGWRKITDAVHERGGIIVLQLWHVGRLSDPLYLNGATPGGAERYRATRAIDCVAASEKNVWRPPRADRAGDRAGGGCVSPGRAKCQAGGL